MRNGPYRRFILGPLSGFLSGDGLLSSLLFCSGSPSSVWSTRHRDFSGLLSGFHSILGLASFLWFILGLLSSFHSILGLLSSLRLCLILSGYRRSITTVSGGCSHLFQHLFLPVHGIAPR